MQVLITAVGLAGALWVLLSGGYSESVENWASGLIGLVVGFWLKPEQKREKVTRSAQQPDTRIEIERRPDREPPPKD
jgi:hypothetical protein